MLLYALYTVVLDCSLYSESCQPERKEVRRHEGRSTAEQNIASISVIHSIYSIYDSPVKTPLFSKAENNAQKFDYRMSILGFCAASF